jgi:hypothetical protein
MGGQPMGFGRAAAVVSIATELLAALGVPLTELDPTRLIDIATLDDPWRPQRGRRVQHGHGVQGHAGHGDP